MSKFLTLIVTVSSLASLGLGHGVVTKPTPRAVGPATLAACGAGAYSVLAADATAPIENVAKKADTEFNATACPFEDNMNNIHAFRTGENIPFLVNINVRHNGFANVSAVDLATQTTIGTPLFNWPVYTDTSLTPAQYPLNETDFSVTLPDLGTRCQTAGACAIQWWWLGCNAQTYMSCVDFATA